MKSVLTPNEDFRNVRFEIQFFLIPKNCHNSVGDSEKMVGIIDEMGPEATLEVEIYKKMSFGKFRI